MEKSVLINTIILFVINIHGIYQIQIIIINTTKSFVCDFSKYEANIFCQFCEAFTYIFVKNNSCHYYNKFVKKFISIRDNILIFNLTFNPRPIKCFCISNFVSKDFVIPKIELEVKIIPVISFKYYKCHVKIHKSELIFNWLCFSNNNIMLKSTKIYRKFNDDVIDVDYILTVNRQIECICSIKWIEFPHIFHSHTYLISLPSNIQIKSNSTKLCDIICDNPFCKFNYFFNRSFVINCSKFLNDSVHSFEIAISISSPGFQYNKRLKGYEILHFPINTFNVTMCSEMTLSIHYINFKDFLYKYKISVLFYTLNSSSEIFLKESSMEYPILSYYTFEGFLCPLNYPQKSQFLLRFYFLIQPDLINHFYVKNSRLFVQLLSMPQIVSYQVVCTIRLSILASLKSDWCFFFNFGTAVYTLIFNWVARYFYRSSSSFIGHHTVGYYMISLKILDISFSFKDQYFIISSKYFTNPFYAFVDTIIHDTKDNTINYRITFNQSIIGFVQLFFIFQSHGNTLFTYLYSNIYYGSNLYVFITEVSKQTVVCSTSIPLYLLIFKWLCYSKEFKFVDIMDFDLIRRMNKSERAIFSKLYVLYAQNNVLMTDMIDVNCVLLCMCSVNILENNHSLGENVTIEITVTQTKAEEVQIPSYLFFYMILIIILFEMSLKLILLTLSLYQIQIYNNHFCKKILIFKMKFDSPPSKYNKRNIFEQVCFDLRLHDTLAKVNQFLILLERNKLEIAHRADLKVQAKAHGYSERSIEIMFYIDDMVHMIENIQKKSRHSTKDDFSSSKNRSILFSLTRHDSKREMYLNKRKNFKLDKTVKIDKESSIFARKRKKLEQEKLKLKLFKEEEKLREKEELLKMKNEIRIRYKSFKSMEASESNTGEISGPGLKYERIHAYAENSDQILDNIISSLAHKEFEVQKNLEIEISPDEIIAAMENPQDQNTVALEKFQDQNTVAKPHAPERISIDAMFPYRSTDLAFDKIMKCNKARKEKKFGTFTQQSKYLNYSREPKVENIQDQNAVAMKNVQDQYIAAMRNLQIHNTTANKIYEKNVID